MRSSGSPARIPGCYPHDNSSWRAAHSNTYSPFRTFRTNIVTLSDANIFPQDSTSGGLLTGDSKSWRMAYVLRSRPSFQRVPRSFLGVVQHVHSWSRPCAWPDGPGSRSSWLQNVKGYTVYLFFINLASYTLYLRGNVILVPNLLPLPPITRWSVLSLSSYFFAVAISVDGHLGNYFAISVWISPVKKHEWSPWPRRKICWHQNEKW